MNNNKNLKKNINDYIFTKGNICCEQDFDRTTIINLILKKYKNIFNYELDPNEYLNWINNDLLIFIGYKIYLEKNKNIKGLKLCNEIDKKMLDKNKKVTLKKIKLLLKNLPLYYLLSFLGYASYKENEKEMIFSTNLKSSAKEKNK